MKYWNKFIKWLFQEVEQTTPIGTTETNPFNKYRVETTEKKYELGKVVVNIVLHNGDKFKIPHEGIITESKNPVNLKTGKIRSSLYSSSNGKFNDILNSYYVETIDNERILYEFYRQPHYVFKKSMSCAKFGSPSFLNEHILVKNTDIKSITAEWYSNIKYVQEDVLVEIK